MSGSFDVAIVGSGFGGSVMACRLAAKGYRVVVLERGKRWRVEDFPRNRDDDWIYDSDEPQKQHGWLDLRFMDDMVVLQGAGVGGGSLIYANVSVDAPAHIFKQGWPPQISLEELKPHYAEVAEHLNLQTLPDGQLTQRYKMMREAAQKLGFEDRFSKVPLAVSFSEKWNYGLDNPIDPAKSEVFENNFGRQQGTCVHLGNCDIGCDVKAKNTLDLNYLAGAEKEGAEIRPLHIVYSIVPETNGYSLQVNRIDPDDERLIEETVRATRVIVAAGSLGSTELLLRCRDQFKTLPKISPRLGYGWSSNGDFLTPSFHEDRDINPTQGPTISSAIDFLDGSQQKQQFFIEDGGFPDLLNNYIDAKLHDGVKQRRYRQSLEELRRARNDHPPLKHTMPWFEQGVDAANGRLFLARKWYAPWRRRLKLDWEIDKSEALIEAIIQMHKRLAKATGSSSVWVPPTWTLLKNLATPHPLGGCNMAENQKSGVVDHLGNVFGYPGLYVIDGAIIPEAIGRNPSKTIAAIAERCAEHFN